MIDVKRNDIEHLNVENRKNNKRNCVIFQSNLEKKATEEFLQSKFWKRNNFCLNKIWKLYEMKKSEILSREILIFPTRIYYFCWLDSGNEVRSEKYFEFFFSKLYYDNGKAYSSVKLYVNIQRTNNKSILHFFGGFYFWSHKQATQ